MRRRWFVARCAMAMAVLAACTATGSDESGERRGAPASTRSPAPSPGPAPVELESTLPASMQSGQPDARLADVEAGTAAGRSWLIAGSIDGGDGSIRPVLWSSPDAVAWTRENLPTSAGPGATAGHVARSDSGTVILGGVVVDGRVRVVGWRRAADAWMPIDLAGINGPGGAAVYALDGGPGGFVATGMIFPPGAPPVPAIWTSPDGCRWRRAAEGVLDRRAVLEAVVVDSGRRVVVGTVTRPGGDEDGVAYWSTGGRWNPAGGGLGGTGGQQVHALAVAPDGNLVAGGGAQLDPATSDFFPAVWTSPTGERWDAVPASRQFLENNETSSAGRQISSLVADGTSLVASGGNEFTPAMWQSSDARTWNSVRPPDPLALADDPGEIIDVAVAGTIVALTNADGVPGVFRRAPGQFWSDSVADPVPFPNSATSVGVSDVVPLDQGWMAVGRRTAGGLSNGRVWLSPDGRRWDEINTPTFDRASLLAAAKLPSGRLVVLGTIEAEGEESFRNLARVWLSDDGGRTWDRLPQDVRNFEAAGSVHPFTVVSGPAGLVAGGHDNNGRGILGARLWHSPDGVRWIAVGDPAVLLRGQQQSVDQVCVVGNRYVAVGSQGDNQQTRPLVMHSADGLTWTEVPASTWGPDTAEPQVYGCGAGPERGLITGSEVDDAGHRRAVIWQSTDGIDWSDTDPRLGGSALPYDMVVHENRYRVLGLNDGRVMGWESDDGREWRLTIPASALVSSSPNDEYRLAGAPDGRFLITASAGNGIRVLRPAP